MRHIVASILLFLVVLNISRRFANAITRRILFSKPAVQIFMGLSWGLAVAVVVAASTHFAYSGLALTIIWYLGGCYMAYVSFGHEQRITDAMAITNGVAVPTYVLASVGLYFLVSIVFGV